MGFSQAIKEEVLIKCARHCCVCHENTGKNIEVHHIKPRYEGGEDSIDNAIPLCYRCHAEAGSYNSKHPKGTKYSRSELVKHRDKWYRIVENGSLDGLVDDHISLRYYQVNSMPTFLEIVERDLWSTPIRDGYFRYNNVFKFWEKMFLACNEVSGYMFGKEVDEQTYIEKYLPKDKKLWAGEYFHRAEEFNIDECKGELDIINYLIDSRLDSVEYSRKYIYEMPGSVEIREFYKFRKFAGLFAYITSKANNTIVISEVDYLIPNEFAALPLDNESSTVVTRQFPPIEIQSGESIILPLTLLLRPFDTNRIDRVNKKNTNYGRSQDSYSNGTTIDSSLCVGISEFPLRLRYKYEQANYIYEVHMFDPYNAFILDKKWECASLNIF